MRVFVIYPLIFLNPFSLFISHRFCRDDLEISLIGNKMELASWSAWVATRFTHRRLRGKRVGVKPVISQEAKEIILRRRRKRVKDCNRDRAKRCEKNELCCAPTLTSPLPHKRRMPIWRAEAKHTGYVSFLFSRSTALTASSSSRVCSLRGSIKGERLASRRKKKWKCSILYIYTYCTRVHTIRFCLTTMVGGQASPPLFFVLPS